MKCRYQLAGGLRHSNNKDSYPRWDSFTKLISSKAGSHPWIILPSSSCPDWAGWARVPSWLLWQPDRSAPINIHIIGKQGGWWISDVRMQLPAACTRVITLHWQRAQIFWGGGEHALSLRRSAAAAAAAAVSHSGTSDAQHAASWCALVCTLWGYLDLHAFAVHRLHTAVGVIATYCWRISMFEPGERGTSQVSQKIQPVLRMRRHCFASGGTPSVWDSWFIPLFSILRAHFFCFLKKNIFFFKKWKDSSLPCANGSTACRKTLGKNPSWLTKETAATRTPRGKVSG